MQQIYTRQYSRNEPRNKLQALIDTGEGIHGSNTSGHPSSSAKQLRNPRFRHSIMYNMHKAVIQVGSSNNKATKRNAESRNYATQQVDKMARVHIYRAEVTWKHMHIQKTKMQHIHTVIRELQAGTQGTKRFRKNKVKCHVQDVQAQSSSERLLEIFRQYYTYAKAVHTSIKETIVHMYKAQVQELDKMQVTRLKATGIGNKVQHYKSQTKSIRK